MKSHILPLLALYLALVSPALALVGGSALTKIPPWFVSLTDSQSSDNPFCDGSLITEDAVLTAANCVEGMDPNILSVQANFNSSTGGESVSVKSIIIHPDYDGRAITSDIALLVLSAPIRIDEYAPLNSKEEDLLVGTSINITGWGGTGLQKGSTELQTLRTIVAPSTYCAHDYGNFYDSLHICAYFLKGGSTEKDAGGPVTNWDGVVVGLGSLGTDARPDGLGVYMRISPYINWIRSNGFAPNVTESYYGMRRKN